MLYSSLATQLFFIHSFHFFFFFFSAMEADLGWPELFDDEQVNGGEYGLPPGFRFHPTDEELVTFYLASKIFAGSFCGVEIVEVDLNRCEPWELPEGAKMGEREWYFYSLRDRKYPTGLRTNRATGAGYWKATGKDREIHAAASGVLVGMKKTLVFYRGRAPRGEKTRWVLHEYRLQGDFSFRHACKEEWVICRIFHKGGGGGGGGDHQKKTTTTTTTYNFPGNQNNTHYNILRPSSSSSSSSLINSSCFLDYYYPQTQEITSNIQSLIQSLHLPFIPQTLEEDPLDLFSFTPFHLQPYHHHHHHHHHPSSVHLNSLLIKPPPSSSLPEEYSSCQLLHQNPNFFCYDNTVLHSHQLGLPHDMPLVGSSCSVNIQSGPLVP